MLNTGLTNNDILDDIVSSDLSAMKNFIFRDVNNGDVKLAADIISHLVRSGGKKVRPKLVFIICKMLNYSGEDRVKVAASVEFIHNATLLHDDVLDESEARHGVKTANKIWGNKSSILVGDLLLTLAFRWLIECGNLNILSILSGASHSLVNGEIKQMAARFNSHTIRKNYFDIIGKKTASLFSACCEAASVISNATSNETERLKNFGLNFGMAFQIIDDTLDYTADQRTSGKQVGKDFFEGKVTLPAIIAYEKGSPAEQKFWEKCFSLAERNFDQALHYINHHNAIQLSIEKARHYVNMAQNNINTFSDSSYKIALIDFLNASIERQA
ncbi:polyprenyl synthetase family protein [Wolbachia endosymbiont of Brugia malayi]|uniref:polyprenyl synthetase family protein n=1 Tax=unclassified Wolbachia TaxID=2640676 RepID=UPI00004C9420|nr:MULTISPECIES: polyprenyl synthetase family protein [unclassified Wolbachia]AAW71120.1 Geranylgeranyl pyrophosphate synthase [Wolbachia endosymbiont strain TRS of Brugia malayi]QCB61324.1 polyprenyl synthetase family protein [Wolbachia endosymbiont of Brugia malayi]QIT36527.1 polyprenyl synthetase family protein [Wolbachia endosymbiont of Brugia pahangi]